LEDGPSSLLKGHSQPSVISKSTSERGRYRCMDSQDSHVIVIIGFCGLSALKRILDVFLGNCLIYYFFNINNINNSIQGTMTTGVSGNRKQLAKRPTMPKITWEPREATHIQKECRGFEKGKTHIPIPDFT